MRTMRVVMFIAVLALLAGPVAADWDEENGHKMHYPQLPDPNGWDVRATVPKILADDFQCSQSGPIKDIHFWGSWRFNETGTIDNIHLSIHADIPATNGTHSMPGPLLWSLDTVNFTVREEPNSWQGWYDPNTGLYETNDHNRYFQYNIEGIEEPWYQEKDTIYWLDIQVSAVGGEWGWKTSLTNWNDDAVWSDDHAGPWNELTDPITDETLDMAFVVNIPEPSSLLLLLIGSSALLGWLKARKE